MKIPFFYNLVVLLFYTRLRRFLLSHFKTTTSFLFRVMEADKIDDGEDDVFAEDENKTGTAEKETKDENTNLLNIKMGVRQCRSLSPQPR